MTRVFIIGAAGKVGRRLTRQLANRGHDPITMYRREEQAEELKALGGNPVAGSLLELTAQELADQMFGSDVVVFSAGAGGAGVEVTNAIDGRGLELAVEAAELANVRRFILVSVFPDALRGGDVSEGFENYIRVKKFADVRLVDSDLKWVILRPGTLLDSPGIGRVRANVAVPYGEVTRDDVAATLVSLIEHPSVSRIIIELTAGDTPIEEAVSRLTNAQV